MSIAIDFLPRLGCSIMKLIRDLPPGIKPDVIKPWMGDSVAWYEGNSLVVETKNYNRQQAGQVFISDTGTLTERITRTGPEDIVTQEEIDWLVRQGRIE